MPMCTIANPSKESHLDSEEFFFRIALKKKVVISAIDRYATRLTPVLFPFPRNLVFEVNW